jgi:hypothetical protein
MTYVTQAGAMSSWHIDTQALITWITIESNDRSGHDKGVVKEWAVVIFNTPKEREKGLQEFAKEGST